MRILILEDNEERNLHFKQQLEGTDYDCIFVETAQACIDELRANEFHLIFLDHDLGGEAFVDTSNLNTGSEVVRWLCQQIYHCNSTIIIHSMNIPAAEHMESLLRAWDFKYVYRIPFIQLYQRVQVTAKQVSRFLS